MSCLVHRRATVFAALAALFAALTLAAGPASAAVCQGQPPWINEVNYDSFYSVLDTDRDEFVEIAAPAGTDLSGYRILAIEGNKSLLVCTTGIGSDNGDAYFDLALPPGSVVGDDTGTGIGFLVVCFTFTSTDIGPACDAVLPTIDFYSNLRNGKLVSTGSNECPDGVLMLDPSGGLVDAVSWEGIIPNTGDYGAMFNFPNPSYNAGEDPGWLPGESLEKTTSNPARATSDSEWQLTDGPNSATPGSANPGQSFVCEPPPGVEDFVAYNDGAYDAASDGQDTDPQGQSVHYTSPNVSYLSIGAVNHGGSQGPSSGYLIDKASGELTNVTASLTESGGVVWQPWILPDNPGGDTWDGGYDADAGTDARNTFGGIVDMVGTTYYGALGWYVDLSFSGLRADKKYTFATSSTGGNPAHSNRFSQYSILGADTYTNASTPGVTEISPGVVYYNTGDNISEGYVARWTNITAADGAFKVRVEAHPSSEDGGRKAYAFDVWMLQELPTEPAECGNGEVEGTEECDDGNTQDGDCCSSSCSYEAAGSPCDDADACTEPDTCNSTGGCVAGDPVDCDNGVFCDGEEYCDSVLGCQPGDPIPVDDDVACTVDICDEGSGTVLHTPDDELCEDGLYCNGEATCDVELDCLPGTPPVVDDGVDCTDDSCDEETDSVVHVPNDALCDDGTFCNGAETCDSLAGCQPGTPPTCDDGVDCTTDLCLTAIDDCLNSPDHASCSNGDVCDGTEVCDPELGCQPGTPLDCDDENECTDDDCRPTLGCRNLPNTDPCNDLNFCTENDVCSGGACSGTEIPGCSAPVPTLGPWAQVFTGLFVLASGVGLLSERRRRSR